MIAQSHLIQARASLADDEPKEAVIVLAALLEKDQPTAEIGQRARYYLGLAYKKDGQHAKAEEILDALAKTPAASVANDARFLLGQSRFDAGQYAESIEPLQQYLQERPDGDVADHALAYLALAKAEVGRNDEAAVDLESLRSRFPKSPAIAPAAIRFAEAAFEQKNFAKAANWFQAASTSAGTDLQAKALSGLGWSYFESKEFEKSAAAFEQCLAAKPDERTAAEAARMRGLAFESAGKLEEAGKSYALVIVRYAQTDQAGPAALARARLLAKSKKSVDAARAYADFIRDHPKSIDAAPLEFVLAEWGWTLVDADDYESADKIFTRLLDEFPESPKAVDARLNLAESAFLAKKFDAVEKLLAPIVEGRIKAEPSIVHSALFRLGRTLVELKDFAGAESTFDKLLTDAPGGSLQKEASFWRSEAAFQKGDSETAEKGFAALIDDDGAKDALWLSTAKVRRLQCFVQQKRWDDVIELAEKLEKELELDPLFAEAPYAKGRALQAQALFDKARTAYETAIASRKRGELAAKAQFMIGETYYHEKAYKDALCAFLKVEILYEDCPTWQAAALLEAGKVHEQLAQWNEAAETYERLRRSFPRTRTRPRRKLARPPHSSAWAQATKPSHANCGDRPRAPRASNAGAGSPTRTRLTQEKGFSLDESFEQTLSAAFALPLRLPLPLDFPGAAPETAGEKAAGAAGPILKKLGIVFESVRNRYNRTPSHDRIWMGGLAACSLLGLATASNGPSIYVDAASSPGSSKRRSSSESRRKSSTRAKPLIFASSPPVRQAGPLWRSSAVGVDRRPTSNAPLRSRSRSSPSNSEKGFQRCAGSRPWPLWSGSWERF